MRMLNVLLASVASIVTVTSASKKSLETGTMVRMFSGGGGGVLGIRGGSTASKETLNAARKPGPSPREGALTIGHRHVRRDRRTKGTGFAEVGLRNPHPTEAEA